MAICSSSSCFCPSPQNDGAFCGGPTRRFNILGGNEFRLRQDFGAGAKMLGVEQKQLDELHIAIVGDVEKDD